MGKTLYLLRHAATSDADSGQKDADRKLTAEGRRDANHLGTFLTNSNITPDTIVTSSATRARETAVMVTEMIGFGLDKIKMDDELYNAPIRILLGTVNELPNNAASALLVGHNPAISFLADYLTTEDIGGMAPCTLVAIAFECDDWAEISSNTGQVQLIKSPD